MSARRGVLPWVIGLAFACAAALTITTLRARSAAATHDDALLILEHPGGDAVDGLARSDGTSLVILALAWLPALGLLGWRARQKRAGEPVGALTRPLVAVGICALVIYAGDKLVRERTAQRMLCISAANNVYPRKLREAALQRAEAHAHSLIGARVWSSDTRAKTRCSEAASYLGTAFAP